MADPTGINTVGEVAERGGNPSNIKGDAEVMSVMRNRLTTAMAAYSDSREDELDDLRFHGW